LEEKVGGGDMALKHERELEREQKYYSGTLFEHVVEIQKP
jgi:hypothetical protein